MTVPFQPFLRSFLTLASGQKPAEFEVGVDRLQQWSQRLGPRKSLEIAQQAALEVTPQRIEEAALQGEPLSGEMLEEWLDIVVNARVDVPGPLLVQSPIVEVGAQSQGQVYLQKAALEKELSSPSRRQFAMAHELAHFVNRDDARKAGIDLASRLCAFPGQKFHVHVREAIRNLELEADEQAARWLVGGGVCAEGVAEFLLSTTAGPEHPDGLLRAEVVRQHLPIEEMRWQELARRSYHLREQSRKHDEEVDRYVEGLSRFT